MNTFGVTLMVLIDVDILTTFLVSEAAFECVCVVDRQSHNI